MKKIRILHVNDNPHDSDLVRDSLSGKKYQITVVKTGREIEKIIDKYEFDIVLIDFNILGFTGLDIIDIIKQRKPDLSFIFLTEIDSEKNPVEFLKKGEVKYVLKSPKHIRHLSNTIISMLNNNEKFGTYKEMLDRYQEVIENHEDLITQVDKDGKIVFINKSAETIFGLKPSECIGRSAFSFIHADDQEKTKNQFYNFISKGIQKGRFENRQINNKGEVYYINWVSHFHYDESGNIIKIYSFGRNVTMQKKTELMLRKSEQESSAMLDSMINAFVLFESVFDKNGKFISYRFVYINRSFEEITGVKNNVVKGKTVYEVWPETEPEWIKRYGDVAVTGESQEFELYHDPTKKIYHCQVYRPFDTSEKFCVIFEDVTESKKAEEKLRNSEKKYRTLFDSVGDAALVLKDQVFINCNTKTEEILNGTKEQIIGKTPWNLSPKFQQDGQESKKKAKKMIKTVLEGGNHQFEWQHKSFDGILVDVEISLNIVDEKNKIIFVIWRDISERKKAELEKKKNAQILIQTQKLRSLGELAAGMAHEIFQPLSGILMASENLDFLGIDSKLNKDNLHQLTDSIKENVKRIKNIIEHVKIFSRDQKADKIDKININESIENAINLIDRQYINSNISLKINLDKALPKVRGNIYKFEQVVLNLLSNSKDAVNEKEMKFKNKKFKKEICIISNFENNYIIIEILDNGIGISGDKVNKLFDPFYTTKESGKGIGLGLSITYGIIKEMNGTIEVESEKLKYTKFIIKFAVKDKIK